MAKKFLVNINLGGNQLLNALMHPASASPVAYGKGQLWFDTLSNQLNVYDGSAFQPLATGGTAVSSLNGFSGPVNIYGTANKVTVTNNSGSITLSLPSTISVNTACASYFYGGAGDFSGLTISGSSVATEGFVTGQGYVTSSGSVAGATNSDQLGGYAASAYAKLSSANFTAASVGGSSIVTQSDLSSASVSTAGNSASLGGLDSSAYAQLASADFTSASVGGDPIVTQGDLASASVAYADNAGSLGGSVASDYAKLASANFTSASIGSNRIITTNDKLSALSSTTSSELAGIISDETGTGSLVFNTNPTFAGTVDLGANPALGVVSNAFNSASLDNIAASAYAQLSSANFTAASVGGNAIATQSYVNGASVAYATNAGNSSTTSQTSFSSLTSSGSVLISASTQSSGSANGALVVTGGVGIGRDVYIGGDLNVSGSVYISGSAFTVSSSNIVLNDPLIYLANGNPSNLIDIGVVGNFDDGTYQHTGFVRDASDGKWKLFSGVTDEPTTTINFDQATYSAIKVGSIEFGPALPNAFINYAGEGYFTGLFINGWDVATQNWVSGSYAPINSPSFTGTVDLGSNVATGSVASANNSASLGGFAASSYAKLSSANFTAASVGGNAIATQSYVSTASVAYANNTASLGGVAAASYAQLSSANFTSLSLGGSAVATEAYVASFATTASVAYATNSGNSATTSQTNFGSLSISGSAVATEAFVGTASVAYATNAGNAATTSQTNFSALTISGSNVATETFVTTQGYITSSGSVAGATNADQLGGTAASAYAQLSSANFTAASVGGVAVSRKFVSVIDGDDNTSSFTITHNLGTRDISVQVYQSSATPDTRYAEVEVDIVRTSTSAATISFAQNVATGDQYRVVIVG